MLCTLTSELNELSDASAIEEWARTLKAAADLICNHAKHVGADVFDTFCPLVSSKAKAFTANLCAPQSDPQASEETMPKNTELLAATDVLHDLSLAFAVDGWVFDLQQEIAEQLQAVGAQAFDEGLLVACTGLATRFHKTKIGCASDPLADADLRCLGEILSKAVVGMHFLEHASQLALSVFVSSAMEAHECKMSAVWSVSVAVAKRATRFLRDEDLVKRANARYQVFEDGAKLTTARANKWDSEEFVENWREKVATLMRASTELGGSAEALRATRAQNSADAATLEALLEKVEVLLEQARGDIESAKERALANMRAKMAAAHKELKMIARGDHERGSGSWRDAKPIDEWAEWEELKETYKVSLKLLKASDLTTAIAASAKASSQYGEVCGFFSCDTVVDETFVVAYSDAVITKMEGCMMKALIELDKDPSKKEATRARLRAEIKEATTKLGVPASTYGKVLPLCLAKKCADCIAMR